MAADSFDIIPRIIPAEEWRSLEAGLRAASQSAQLLLNDIYHDREILRAGKTEENRSWERPVRPVMAGDVPEGIYAHIAGVDVVQTGAGEFYVLEDNLRFPPGCLLACSKTAR